MPNTLVASLGGQAKLVPGGRFQVLGQSRASPPDATVIARAAPLPSDDTPAAPPAQMAATTPAKSNDVAAAAALRAMLSGQRTLSGTLPTEPARRP